MTKKARTSLLFAGAGTIASVIVLALIQRDRTRPVAEIAEDLVISAVQTGRLPSDAVISNGSYGFLTEAQSRAIISDIVHPALEHYTISKTEHLTPSVDSGGVSVELRGPNGIRHLVLSGKPKPHGAVFTLDGLLRISWSISVPDAPNMGAKDWSLVRMANLKGIAQSRARLEDLGIVGVDYGHQGAKSWDELIAWYSRSG